MVRKGNSKSCHLYSSHAVSTCSGTVS